MVLIAARNDDREIKVAKRPSLDTREESEYEVWLYSEASDKSAKLNPRAPALEYRLDSA